MYLVSIKKNEYHFKSIIDYDRFWIYAFSSIFVCVFFILLQVLAASDVD